MLDTGEATCLGVTCRRFYIVLKDLYPEPISLRTQIVLRGSDLWYSYCTDLYEVLANWVGPRYRMGRRSNIKLLYYNKEVYVPGVYSFQNREWRSNTRHSDYETVQHLYDKYYRPDRASPNPLSNPFNKGDAWNAETIAIIEASIYQFVSTEDWKRFWSCTYLFCSKHEYFDRFEDQYKWGM